MARRVLLLAMTLLALATARGETHPEVARALAWTLPAHHCETPEFQGREESDVAKRRFEKAVKRFRGCIEDYKTDLLAEHRRMMQVARHGLTQAQATAILTHLKTIQTAIETPATVVLPSANVPLDTREFYDRVHGS